MQLLNFDLLKNPWNWVHVILMVLIAGIAIHLVLSYQTSPNVGGNTQ